jgi:ribosomal protein S18 acetylase RimI-like enzyme
MGRQGPARGGRVRMYLPRLDALPHLDSLAGYTIRRFMPGEERAWWNLLDDAGGLGTWDAKRAEEAFADPSGRVWKESIHFAVVEEHLVGTACVQLNARRDDLAEMGWVAVASAHRGRGLGRILCLHILWFMRQRGFQHCFVQTRSHRAAAVKLFRDLGFQPRGAPGDGSLASFFEALPHRARVETQGL